MEELSVRCTDIQGRRSMMSTMLMSLVAVLSQLFSYEEKGLRGEFEDLSLTTDVAGEIDDYDIIDRALGILPKFESPEQNNITVIAGMTATLPCSIEHLAKYKMAWLDAKSIPLTLEDRRVIDDSRFSIVRPSVNDWNLQIRDTKWEDHGRYLCSVNTLPAVQSILIMLTVKVPAQIIDELSTNDITVQEGSSFSLVCNVTGVPRPVVTWYRRPSPTLFRSATVNIHETDGRDSTWREQGVRVSEQGRGVCELAAYNSGEEGRTGEILYIHNVSRYCGNVYECNATNEVPPSVTRAMIVTVEFKPEIKMTNTKIAQSRGRETILECRITAFPRAVNYWEKDGKQISSSPKHRIEAFDEDDNSWILSLRIQSIDSTDYGEYRCFASNALGRDSGVVYLAEPEPIMSRSLTHSRDPQVVVIPLQHSKDPDGMPAKIGRQTLAPGHHRPDQQRQATEHGGRGKDTSVSAVNNNYWRNEKAKHAPSTGLANSAASPRFQTVNRRSMCYTQLMTTAIVVAMLTGYWMIIKSHQLSERETLSLL